MENAITGHLLGMANETVAKQTMKFFKTGKGQYSHHDIFIGIKMGDIREAVKNFFPVKTETCEKLLASKYHEVRMFAVVALVELYKKSNAKERSNVFKTYLRNTKGINNWDLVDASAHHIVGAELFGKDTSILHELSQSRNMWERRIAIVSTLFFIRKGHFGDTFELSKKIFKDKEDLMHKSTGWMLREVGKKDMDAERIFLIEHYKKMPRTMLRYAIERFPENERAGFLKGEF